MQQTREVRVASLAKKGIGRHAKKAISYLKRSIARQSKNVESVHQLRTETRRADAIIRLLEVFLPHRRAEKFRRRLKRLRAKAGRVRDLDVLRESLQSLEHQMPKEAAHWLAQRAKSKRSKAMDSLRCQGRKWLQHDWKTSVDRLTHRLRRQTNDDETRRAMELAIQDLATKLFQTADCLKNDALQMHPTRILARRLRYTIELSADVIPSLYNSSLTDSLSRIQNVLGGAKDFQSVLDFAKDGVAASPPQSVLVSLAKLIQVLEESTAKLTSASIQEASEICEQVKLQMASVSPPEMSSPGSP